MNTSSHGPGAGWAARLSVALLTIALCAQGIAADAPADLRHAAWSDLLADCVVETADRGGTAVDYRCMAENQSQLSAYLDALSALEETEFKRWHRTAQLAFLINAYNAWTVQLILEHYPGIESIRDIGGLLSSPWKRRFVPLLGSTRSLDDIEHGMIRGSGRFLEPRIHFAVNCASIGCPALRREAYEGPQLEAQLEQQTEQFLSDRSRNRLRDGRLEVSPLFKWYRSDFERPWRGGRSLEAFLAGYSSALGLGEAQRAELLAGKLPIRFGDYDWKLNDVAR